MLGAITAGIFGAIVGACIGGIATAFGLPFPKSIFLSFGLSLLASFMFFNMAGNLNEFVKKTILCFLVFGTIFGTLVSLLNQNRQQKFKDGS